MEIVSGLSGNAVYRCTNDGCRFVGDGLDLYLTAKRLDSRDMAASLIEDRLISIYDQLQADVSSYLTHAAHRRHVNDWWLKANLRFQQRSEYAMDVLRSLGLTYDGICQPQALGSHMGVATGYQIFETFGLAAGARHGIRPRQHHTLIPLWADPITITGLSLVCADAAGDVHYRDIQLQTVRSADIGLGFVSSCRIFDESVVVYTDPLSAMQMIDDCASQGLRPSVVYAPHQTRMLRRLPNRRKIVVNLDNNMDSHRLALDSYPCLVLNRRLEEADDPTLVFNSCTSVHQALDLVAVSPHKAIADHLANTEPMAAKIDVQRLNPDTQDVNKIIAACEGAARGKVMSLLKADMSDRQIRVGGRLIYQSVDGWFVDGKNGPELVSDTRFTIDTVFWDSERGQAVASGVIYQQGGELPFQALWETIEKDTYQWLTKSALDAQLSMPDVRNGWHKKLLDISKSFHKPPTQHATTVSAWSGNRLTLPQIIVEAGAVRENDEVRFTDAGGAGLSMPEPLTAAERQTLVYVSPHTGVFWALFCAVARNVLSPVHRGGTSGIAVVERQRGLVSQILDVMRSEVGFETVSFESQSRNYLTQVTELERRCPFPIFVDDQWNNSRGFRQWLKTEGGRNCVVRMSPEVRACTALEGGWTYISCQADIGDGWRGLDGLWRLLPSFIAFVQRTPVGKWQESSLLLTEQIMDLIGLWLETELKLEANGVLQRAKKYCTMDRTTESSWSSRFVSFLIDAMAADRIRLRSQSDRYDICRDLVMVDEKMVFVSQKAVSTLLKELGAQDFPAKFIYDRLTTNEILKSKSFDKTPGYGIDIFQWNLTSSLRVSQS